jgi:endonuclease-3
VSPGLRARGPSGVGFAVSPVPLRSDRGLSADAPRRATGYTKSMVAKRRGTARVAKQPFDIDVAMARLREAVRPYPPAVLFSLYDEGFTSLFQQVVACIISIRTLEEVTGPAARRLLGRAGTPAAMLRLSPEQIAETIKPATFYEPKGRWIHAIARVAEEQHGGTLPCDGELLQSLPGVGPKCANLALGIACGVPLVAVDVHVHRVANRWGYIKTATPEQSSVALNQLLPEQYRIEINRLLVPFGKYICTGRRPHCSTCPLLDMCQQIGVASHQ